MRGHALLAAALLLAQAGATPRIGPAPAATGAPRVGPTTPAGRALDGLTNSVTRPVPTLPAPPTGQHPADVWVPDRIVPIPGQTGGGALVPGHWERRLSDREHYVPPLVIRTPDGRTTTVPAGVAPPPEQRQGP